MTTRFKQEPELLIRLLIVVGTAGAFVCCGHGQQGQVFIGHHFAATGSSAVREQRE